MINVENLSKGFAAQTLFEGVSFKFNPKERIGVVGRNGHGKTTLFKMLAGEDRPDSGVITFPKFYHVGYVRQQIEFTRDNVLEEAMTGLRENERDHHWKAEKILSGLGFGPGDMQRPPDEFSGGYQVRLNLAKVLVSEPDLLLLDEPTNYLDITSIRWIQRFLVDWPREVMLITHDRSFMDRVVTHILGIHHRKIRKIAGNTETYYSRIAQEEEIYEKTRINDERRKKEIEQFITRFRAKARLANLVQSRIKTLKKLDKKDKMEAVQTLDFSFRAKPFQGKYAASVRGLSFSYHADTPLISDLSFSVNAGDKICVIGRNGRGKTTLLKLLAGVITPRAGEISYHPAIETGFFEQTHISHLVDNRTVEEEILYSHADVDRQQARNICGAMLFRKDQALKKIRVLSGGEKSRVLLGKLLVTPLNLLILDEPTNHLDMDACDALLAAIDSFDGTVIMVTHNEMFLHAIADRLIIFRNEGIDVFEGGYQDFLEKIGWEEERDKKNAGPRPAAPDTPAAKATRKELRRQRSEIIALRSKALKKIERQIARTESDIETREKKMQQLEQAMLDASHSQEGQKIADISKSMHACRIDVDALFDQLEKLTETLETQRAVFDRQLDQIDRSTES